MVERTHLQLKDALRACGAAADWPRHLPWVLLGMLTMPKEDSNISSAEVVFGAPLVLPGQLPGVPGTSPPVFQQDVCAAPSSIPSRGPPADPAVEKIPKQLQEAAFVYVRQGGHKTPLATANSSPFAVISLSPKFFVID